MFRRDHGPYNVHEIMIQNLQGASKIFEKSNRVVNVLRGESELDSSSDFCVD